MPNGSWLVIFSPILKRERPRFLLRLLNRASDSPQRGGAIPDQGQ
jgi:hypothetical protein